MIGCSEQPYRLHQLRAGFAITILIVILSFLLYLLAYHTYGRYLAKRIFGLDPTNTTPANELNDGVDFVPSHRSLVFGHHFTSIAGTGPIVGPAIAVVWGWVPALVWVLVGSILMGAVHDFGSLIISMRHKGRTIADLSGSVINARVRFLFMLVCLIGLWIVLAIFGLVIATIFDLYPQSVIPVFAQIPIAIGLGIWLKRDLPMVLGSVVAVGLMYWTIWWASSNTPVWEFPSFLSDHLSTIGIWTIILMMYVFIASVLPVNVLLQPRDFINSWQLLIVMGLLVAGVFVAQPSIVADAVRLAPEVSASGRAAPPMMPFLFITIACGAISGFHCLVSSGCSSRQLKTEGDAQYVGYGAMLTEGFLAVLVIIACVAGVGIGVSDGREEWLGYYRQWGGDGGLGAKLSPFIEGSAKMLGALGVPQYFGITLMGVFVASFAATTLDSATRLQRYIIAEVAGGGRSRIMQDTCGQCGYSLKGIAVSSGCPECGADESMIKHAKVGWIGGLMANRFGGTLLAVMTALMLALSDAFMFTKLAPGSRIGSPWPWYDDGSNGVYGSRVWGDLYVKSDFEYAGLGGLQLWPIFGATNQLLASLALLVITVWLVQRKRNALVTGIPMVFMLGITGYAILLLTKGFYDSQNGLLMVLSVLMLVLQVWILVEGVFMLAENKSDHD
ncbi:MAG: carbon starvation protein A [Phycisphaerales bacterium]